MIPTMTAVRQIMAMMSAMISSTLLSLIQITPCELSVLAVGVVRSGVKLTSSHNPDEISVEVEAYRLFALRAEEGVAVFACGDF